jgi:ubiquinone/menaquinone biosynthesis C-methylase UbiE
MKMGKIQKLAVNSEWHKKWIITLFKKMMDTIEVKECQHFLDIGCGSGAVPSYFAKPYTATITGIDIDREEIKKAQSRTRKPIYFLQADATHLPFKDETVDIITCLDVLHHIKTWKNALKEIKRVLKPNGYLIYTDIFYSRAMATIRALFNHGNRMTAADFTTFMEQHGIFIVHVVVSHYLIFDHYKAVLKRAHTITGYCTMLPESD